MMTPFPFTWRSRSNTSLKRQRRKMPSLALQACRNSPLFFWELGLLFYFNPIYFAFFSGSIAPSLCSKFRRPNFRKKIRFLADFCNGFVVSIAETI
jgi:hypothetical protein